MNQLNGVSPITHKSAVSKVLLYFLKNPRCLSEEGKPLYIREDERDNVSATGLFIKLGTLRRQIKGTELNRVNLNDLYLKLGKEHFYRSIHHFLNTGDGLEFLSRLQILHDTDDYWQPVFPDQPERHSSTLTSKGWAFLENCLLFLSVKEAADFVTYYEVASEKILKEVYGESKKIFG